MDSSREAHFILTVVVGLTSVSLGGCGDSGGSGPPGNDDPGPACARNLATHTDREVLRFSSASSPLTVHIERVYAGQGAGHSTLWDLEAFSILENEECRHTEISGQLNYENSHHNWYDRASATIDAGGATRGAVLQL